LKSKQNLIYIFQWFSIMGVRVASC